MDSFKGILVQVVSNGQILKSYDDPDANQFDFCHISRKDGVQVCFRVDGNDWDDNFYETRERLEESFQAGIPCTFGFDEFTHFSDKTGRWMKSEYSFNAFKLNESTCVDLAAQVQDLGTIEISVQRVRLRHCSPSREEMIPVKTITEVPERALKGKAIENNVKLTEGVPAKAPKRHNPAVCDTISGRKGILLVHKILYRSRRTLQMIGCIPPDPSSTPITIPEDQEQDSASGLTSINPNAVGSQELQQQVQSLRAQLALLERSLTVKSEAPETNTQVTPQPSNIKREREEDENAAPRQRRRISAKVETIDLTDD
ncbi:hypothetical protein JMJ35_007579 [Cladonia borealis]|uniref:DUF7918 domain-containing protein n=1 Tax=Cladonia borealis TaxID=184061 RepID=A0AA39QY16_9LECA|nr:hypothetical protein JMJ35_007579 [Cladonia borealis]